MLTGSPSIPLDGEYHGKKLLVSAGTWVTRLLPDLSYPAGTQGVRLVPGRWPLQQQESLSGLHRRVAQWRSILRFPAKDNELKIGKHNGGQPISTPQERVALALSPAMVPNPSRFA